MKLVRNLAVGLLLAGGLMATSPAEARHRHDSRCGHNYRYDRHDRYDRYDRHDRYDRYDRRDYRYRSYDPYRYGYGGYDSRYDYGYRYRTPVRYHYHGRSRCSRSHVGIFFGF